VYRACRATLTRGEGSALKGIGPGSVHFTFLKKKEPTLKTARRQKASRNRTPLLVSVAESIGSTLGSIAAKADAAQKAMSRSDVIGKFERESKKLVRTGKRAGQKAARNLAKNKTVRKARRTLRRATAKRAASRRAKARK
jgi:hypothetical protein